MEVVVTGRHTDVKERFRRHVEAKLDKVPQLAPRVQRIDVEVSHEKNRRQASSCERVEITVRDKGPVVRAEACADDPYAALDLATTKLYERLRRARDRRKVHHGRRGPTSLHQAVAGMSDEALTRSFDPGRPLAEQLEAAQLDHAEADGSSTPTPAVMSESKPPTAVTADSWADVGPTDASPVVIREKTHDAEPMTLDQAMYEMELVGHDFYLFVDAATGAPSVVYRRRGWDYGVIHLDVQAAGERSTADHGAGADLRGGTGALSAVAAAAMR